MTFMIYIRKVYKRSTFVLVIYFFLECVKGHHNSLFSFDVITNRRVPYKIIAITIRAIACAREITPAMGNLRGSYLTKRPALAKTLRQIYPNKMFHSLGKIMYDKPKTKIYPELRAKFEPHAAVTMRL